MKRSKNNKFKVFGILVMLILPLPSVYAEDDEALTAVESELIERMDRAGSKLEEIVTLILQQEQEIGELRRELRRARDAREKETIANTLGEKAIRSGELHVAFEEIATAGETLTAIKEKTKSEKFDWRHALVEVFQPLITELQKISERPREIERLRSEQAFFQSRVPAVEAVLRRVAYLKSNATSEQAKNELQGLEQRWSKRLVELKNKQSIASFNLEERLNDDTFIDGSRSAIQGFFSGRGLNILLAFSAFAGTYLVLFYLNVSAKWFVSRYRRRKANVLDRLSNLIYQILIVIAAIFAGLSVLYFRGDWIVLGVGIILLLGIAWTVRYSVPHMLLEMKVLLNMGPVRERERLVYEGVPWKIMSLGVYSKLVNPWLRGGTLRLPLNVLANCQSRPFGDEEPWFPSRENDYVLLDDGVYGKVVMQSPETVQIESLSSIKSYTLENFMQCNPRNLSMQGFLLLMEFGLDYQLQSSITNDVRNQLEKSMLAGIEQEDIHTLLTSFSVKFSSAGASALNFMLMASFSGSAAAKYYSIQRTLQSLAVEACNQHGWAIPFNQMTVHLQPNETR